MRFKKKTLINIYDKVLSYYQQIIAIMTYIISSSICFYCYKIIIGGSLCEDCWGKLVFVPSDLCGICGRKVIGDCYYCQLNSRSLFLYNFLLSQLILQFKYGKKYYIGQFFIKLMGNIYKKKDEILIMYIPHYGYKQITTSINSSLLLAYEFQKEFGGRVIHNVLIKQSKLRQKHTRNYKERLDNSFKSYTINKILGEKMLKNQNVLLIDDIVTTGSTLLTCGNLIKSCCPKSLQIITVGKVL